MPRMRIDAIGVTSRNIAETARFYAFLGFAFPNIEPDTKHLEAITADGDVRLMIDDRDLMTMIMGNEPTPPSHASFAVLCESPAAVDQAVAKVRDAGFPVLKTPWDADWGQRYAIVADPDGYTVDLFAAI